MKVLIIPDVHGRTFWKEPCKHIDEFDKTIFLGDYVDHYPQEGDLDDLQALKDVIEFAKDKDNVQLLLGNHDYHYIDDNYRELAQCSRFSYQYLNEYHSLYRDNIKLFKIVDKVGDVIFSHAGINKEWAKNCGITNPIEINDKDENWLSNNLSFISSYRGGWNNAGSCVWSDLMEMIPENLPSNIKFQVFGHTQLNQPLVTPKWACLDCREAFYIDNDLNIHPWDHSDKTVSVIEYNKLYSRGA